MGREGDPMEPVQIGVRQIYDLLTALDGKLDSYMHAQEPRLAVIDHRLTRLEESYTKAGDRMWLLWLTLITSFIALLCALIPILAK